MCCYLQQQWRAFYHLLLEDELHLHQEILLAAETPMACSVKTVKIIISQSF